MPTRPPSSWRSLLLGPFAVAAACSPTTTGPVHAADDTGAPPIRGIVRAAHQATLTTDLALLAVEVPFREGDRFGRGDVLLQFDCRRRQAEHDAADALHREAALNLESARQLDKYKAVGRNDVEIAHARADKARADLDAHRARLDDCRLTAPFAGRIAELGIRRHERAVPQKPLMTIIDDSRLEIETIVPSEMLAVLTIGTAMSFRLDELGGKRIGAAVSSIAAAVDPVSKTIKVVAAPSTTVTGLLAGMSGTATFEPGAQP